MSAICGIFSRDGRPLEPEWLAVMMNALSHRGRDGAGVWWNGPVGIGQQWLQIAPEPVSEQFPVPGRCGQTVIAADARIDNREEMFDALRVSGPERPHLPDHQLILLAYERWGEACPEHLEGSFTFAIWEEECQRLFCAVDALGSRRLYVYCTERIFAFSTEIKALLALPCLPARLDEAGFTQHAALRKAWRDPEATCFAGITLMPAATARMVTTSGVRMRTYWQPNPEREITLKNEEAYLEQFHDLFFDAVRSCLRTEFPIVSLLSGGLDSSSVVCVAARLLREQGRELIAVSSALPPGYPGPEADERHHIGLVQRQENITVHYIHPPIGGLYDSLEAAADMAEGPILNQYHYLYSAFQETELADQARVFLCGGGGELGPSSHGNSFFMELAARCRWLKLASVLREVGRVEERSQWQILSQRVLRPLLPAPVFRFCQRVRGSKPVSFADGLVLRRDFFQRTMAEAGITPPDYLENHNRVFFSQRRSDYYNLMNSRIPTSWSTRVDQEVWFPFRNKRLIEFCLAVPGDMKVRHGWSRYLLRAGMEGVLPPEIQWRKSKGPFSPDFFRRLSASRPGALQFLAEVEADSGLYDFIKPYMDLNKIRETARSSSPPVSWAGWRGFDPNWMIVMRGIHALAFLKWAREKIIRRSNHEATA